jgi:uncharacterized membrane protein
MTMPRQYSRLLPWYIGIAVIVAFEAMIGYLFYTASPPCAAPIPQLFFLLLIVLPVVYLGLMFLTLRSQP